jgi:DNA polymerase
MTQDKVTRLNALADDTANCRKCVLYDGRTNVVFGEGDVNARVMIIGEAPGKNEDLTGSPFVGAAGKYLNELLEIACLSREDVFIANVVKCRPPDNRNPRPEEIQACAPYLREQTRIVSPEIIVTLGNFATKFILKTDRGITELRGRPVAAGKFTVLPVFHPAAAIYDRTKRDALTTDFELLKNVLQTGTM